MENIIAFCAGKINLSLNILGRGDTLHYLDSIMLPVKLCDIVYVKKRRDNDINICFMGEDFVKESIGKNNTVKKAVDILKANYGEFGADIVVQKNLPIGGGLGGSSADSAGAIMALNVLFGFVNQQEKLFSLAKNIGSDVPFSMMVTSINKGNLTYDNLINLGTKSVLDPFEALKKDIENINFDFGARVTGTGDILKPIKNNLKFNIVVATKKGLSVNSGDAYQEFDKIYEDFKFLSSDNDKLEKALITGNKNAFEFMGNALQLASENLCPDIKLVKKAVYDSGAFFALMTGSGCCVAGFFENENNAKEAQIKLNKNGFWARIG